MSAYLAITALLAAAAANALVIRKQGQGPSQGGSNPNGIFGRDLAEPELRNVEVARSRL